MLRQVIVGVDGHQGSREAFALAKLPVAKDGAVAKDGELTLAYVYAGQPNESVVTAAAVDG